jgi:hypothetical protein
VNPGYALDCCGNDIVVPCPAQLDINDLYRKLRASASGADCGDPCSDTSGKTRTTKQEVCLWVRYCESEADPVAPYATGDNCAAAQCQPTRIQEGYSFELRCRGAMAKPNTMLNRIANCIGDPAKAEVVGRDSLSLDRIMKPASRAIEEIRTAAQLTFTPADATAMATHAQNLHNLLTSHAQGNTTWTSDTFLTAIGELRSTAGLVTRYYATRKEAAPPADDLGAPPAAATADQAAGGAIATAAAPTPPSGLEAALAALKNGADTLQPLIATTVQTALDQAASQAVVELTIKWANGATTPAKVAASLEGQYFARSVAFTPALLAATRDALVNQQTWLLARTDCAQPSTDCSYSDDLHRIQPSAPPSQTITEPIGELSRMYYEYSVLSGALIRYLRQCGCGAVNPPCPPCDDMGVLLACLEMENCRVVRVCNLERTFALTPVAARYWLPLSEYGDEIEELCCPIPRRAKSVLDVEKPILSAASPVMRSIDALFGGGSLTTFAQAVTTSPLDALRMRVALQAFRNKLVPAAASADVILAQAYQDTQAATVNDRIDAVRADTMAQLEVVMSEIKQLRQDLASSKKKPKTGVNP